MRSGSSVVVFADADALPDGALDLLARERIALVLSSSDTRAELELRRQDLGVGDPFLSETGSAMFVPPGYFGFQTPGARKVAAYEAVEFGRRYEDVTRTLHRVAARLDIDVVGFSDMSVDEVGRDCGLPLMRARLAKLREYQEVFRLRTPDAAQRMRLRKALQGARLRSVGCGRYDRVGTVFGPDRGITLLTRLYRLAGPTLSVGVTPGAPDRAFRRAVDRCVAIPLDKFESWREGPVEWTQILVEWLRKLSHAGSAQVALPSALQRS